ncbi:MAG TPA: polysaccharide biosynthesis/export family protein [Mucilaginibacter sp.]|nr:polysaccharide biosynthesis/export family protein [Mucilaginibacter sp.]
MRFYTALTITIIFCGIFFTSCAYKQQQLLFQQADSLRTTQDYSGTGTSDYHIHSQDILQIRNLQSTRYIVDEEPTTATSSGAGGTSSSGMASQGQTYQVDDDGTVALPVIGRVKVAGLTRAEAAKVVEDLYRQKLLKDPIIDLKITNLKVTVLGEIRAQGNYPLVKDRTNLVEMIGEAGGLTEKANEKDIKIIRGDPKNPQITEVDLSKIKTLADPRIILQNNDIIYIAQNKRAVKNDQIINFSSTIQPILIILNTALIIYTFTRK